MIAYYFVIRRTSKKDAWEQNSIYGSLVEINSMLKRRFNKKRLST